MSAHTPGPWSTNGTFVWPTVDRDLIQQTGHVIAMEVPHDFTLPVPDEYTRDTSETRAANARLIAAAPELYEALQTLVGACVDAGWPVKAEHTMPLVVARAALAKVDA